MTETQSDYVTEAMELLQGVTLEISEPQKVVERRGGKLVESDRPAFVKIYTDFKDELKNIDGDALKVWLFLALSINRYTKDARPGLRKIAEKTGLAVNTVRGAIERLETKYNLLDVEKEDGKGNQYHPSDYVSVSKDTVSNRDTVTQTVSKSSGTVSKTAVTVSGARKDSAQLEELESTILKNSKPNFKELKPSDYRKIPELKTFIDATGWIPGSFVLETVYNFIHAGLTLEKISAAFSAWTARGYKPSNVEGYLTWARDGIPAAYGNAQVDTGAKPAINTVAVEATKQLLDNKFSGNFVPRPAHVQPPQIRKDS